MARTDTLTNYLTDVATAIKTKKGDNTPIQASNFDTEIANLPSGGGTIEEKDVNFYDYDGKLLYSYTKEDFALLSEMPSNPTHTGLIAQGWNWQLSHAKNFVANNGELYIGQTYTTDDGTTRIYVDIPGNNFSVDMDLKLNTNTTCTINWGDNTTPDTLNNTGSATNIITHHNFATKGSYKIIINVTQGSIQLEYGTQTNGSRLFYDSTLGNVVGAFYPYLSCIKKIEFGNNITIGNRALYFCFNIEKIVFPASAYGSASSAFNSCRNIKCFILPIPSSNYQIPEDFLNGCYSLEKIVFPDNQITNRVITQYGKNAFRNCFNLKKVIFPIQTFSQNSMGQSMFQGNTMLEEVIFQKGSIPFYSTANGTSFFQTNTMLKNVAYPLSSVGNNCFSGCVALEKVKFTQNVSSLTASSFTNCWNCLIYDFSNNTSIPTAVANSTFANINKKAKIIVPDNLYNNWKSNSNWSDVSSYIVKASDV